MHRIEKYEIKNITFCRINIRSILFQNEDIPRINLLHNFITKEYCCDIVALTETHLDNSINSSELELDGYSLFRKDRNRSGGGVMFYVRNELNAVQLLEADSPGVESIYVKVSSNHFSCVCGVCYRPPGQSMMERKLFLDNLTKQLDIFCGGVNIPFYLMGDFNDRCSVWDSSHNESELNLNLKLLLDEYCLYQMIDTPTRGPNLLDLFITDSPTTIMKHGITDPFDSLDHSPIYAVISIQYKRLHNYKRLVRNYTDENLQLLNNNLNLVPWHSVLLNDIDIDDMVDSFYSIVNSELNNCIPEREVTVRLSDKPGMNANVRRLLRKSNRLQKLSKCTIMLTTH